MTEPERRCPAMTWLAGKQFVCILPPHDSQERDESGVTYGTRARPVPRSEHHHYVEESRARRSDQ